MDVESKWVWSGRINSADDDSAVAHWVVDVEAAGWMSQSVWWCRGFCQCVASTKTALSERFA